MPSNLHKINTLYLSLDALEQIYLEEERSIFDYKNIGFEYKDIKINLSQVMYGIIEKKTGSNKGTSIAADLSTYNPNHSRFVDGIIMSAIKQKNTGGNSGGYIRILVNNQLQFFDWLRRERLGYPNGIEQGKKTYQAYEKYLRDLMKFGKFRKQVAHMKQLHVLRLLEELFDDRTGQIGSSAPVIRANRVKEGESKKHLLSHEIEYAFAFYYHFFDQVADFLLEGKPYPHNIQLPRGNAVLLPVRTNVVPGYEKIENSPKAVDYSNGRIISDADIEKLVKELPSGPKKYYTKDNSHRYRDELLKKIEHANADITHEERLRLGNRAMKAYFMVLLAVTGSNDSTLASQLWDDDDFATSKTSQEFRAIKPRAGNKKIRFEIRKGFINSFRKFLRLRRFVLDGAPFDYLFFSGYGDGANVTSGQKNGQFGSGIFLKSFSNLDSELSNAYSRDFRKEKSKDLRNSRGLAVALASIQNNLSTYLEHYSGESKEEKANQVASFLTAVHDKVTNRDNDAYIESATGKCEAYESPESDGTDDNIKPDCNDPRTCIFCLHYRTHPEKSEIRKLLSLEYVIKEVSLPRASDQKQYDRVMEPWLRRIKDLTTAMEERDPAAKEQITLIRKEVFEDFELTSYWYEWLKLFDDLGAIS